MCISVNVVADYLKSNCIELYDEIYNRGFADGLKIDKEDERNNAIDDFIEKFSLEISESFICGMIIDCYKDNNFNDTPDKIVDYVIDTVKKVAEQLKEGGKNETVL